MENKENEDSQIITGRETGLSDILLEPQNIYGRIYGWTTNILLSVSYIRQRTVLRDSTEADLSYDNNKVAASRWAYNRNEEVNSLSDPMAAFGRIQYSEHHDPQCAQNPQAAQYLQ